MNVKNRAFFLAVMWMLALCCTFGTGLAESGATDLPMVSPTAMATAAPTAIPTEKPTAVPTAVPTAELTAAPIATPAAEPTAEPTAEPMAEPSAAPAETPASEEKEDEMPLGVNDLLVQAEIEQQVSLSEQAFTNATLEGSFYADYTFGGVQYIHGIYSVLSLYAEVPEYVTPTTAVLRVSYTASDLILSDLSSLTFYMNGTPFYSTYVAVNAEQNRTVLYITVPVELLVPGYNLLEISSYVRLTDNEGCTDDYNGANWIKFDDTTCLRIAYEVSEAAEELSTFPYPFISMMDKTGANCAVTVSDAMDDSELTAAMTVMADLGASVATQNDIETAKISDTERAHVIYFGLAANTPEKLLALLDQEVPPTGALIQRATDEEREYLLVISKEPEALLEAARLLSDNTRVSQLHDRRAYVSVGEARAYIDAGTLSSLAVEGQYTFKDMLGHGASFVGPFHQATTIYLPVPEDYALSSEGRFSFNIRYSENLDWDRSLMTVYWGTSLPLYSRQLSREGARGETVTFSVPSDAVGVAGTYLTIAFDLEVKDLDCTPRQLNMPWAYIAEDSLLYLPHGEKVSLSLSNRPAPFQRNSRLNNVLVVLPEQPDADELMLCGRTVAMLGSGSNPYGEMKVIRDREFNEAAHADCNLILIGKAKSNRMIAGMNNSLLFKYTDDLTRIASNDKLILNDAYAREVGVIQLLISPYSVNRAVLVVTAPEASGLQALTDRISADKTRWALTKEAALVDAHGQATSYQFTAAAEVDRGEEAPTFTRIIVEHREPMLLLLTGLGSMLVVLIGMLVIALRVRRRNRGKKE